MDWKAFFRSHHLFRASPLSDSDFDKLLDPDVSKEVTCNAGEVVVTQNEEGNALYFIGRGSVVVSIHMPDDKEAELGSLSARDFFGELTLLGKRRRSATVRAREPTELLMVDGMAFRTILAKHPSILSDMLLELNERLRALAQVALNISYQEVTDKLQLFSTKLDAELRATQAELTSSKAIFDHTNARAQEAIQSTERTMSLLTKVGTVVSTGIVVIAGILSFFGWNKLESATQAIQQEQVRAKVAADKAEETSKVTQDLSNDMQTRSTQVDELGGHVQELVRALTGTASVVLFPAALDRLIQEASSKVSVSSATVMYKEIMRSGESGAVTFMFKKIYDNILNKNIIQEFGNDNASSVEKLNPAHLESMRTILEAVDPIRGEKGISPRDIALSYYFLVMTNSLLGDTEETRSALDQLRRFVQTAPRGLLMESDEDLFDPKSAFDEFVRSLEKDSLISEEVAAASQDTVGKAWRLMANK